MLGLIFVLILSHFGVLWGAILGAKMLSKWVQNSTKKLIDFWIAPGRGLGRQQGTTTPSDPPVLGPRGGVGEG